MEFHPATIWESISDSVGDRLAIAQGPKRRTWEQFEERSARLASVLLAHGVGEGSTVGQLLYNSPEYLESYFAALKIRAVPFNINYRYTANELAYLLTNADADALVYHASLGSIVAVACTMTPAPKVLIEVDDDGATVVEGTLRYEDAIAGHDPAPRITREPSDRSITYTGGTTGLPKGVVGKVGPGIEGLLKAVPPLLGQPPIADADGAAAFALDRASAEERIIALPAPPLMHATGLGLGALPALAVGGAVVLLPSRRFDARELWDTAATEGVTAVTIVGDPFARPMLAELDRAPDRDLSRVKLLTSSGAMFSSAIKNGLHEQLPQLAILDFIAATEGVMGMALSATGLPAVTGRFTPGDGVIVIDDAGEPVAPGSGGIGRIAIPGGESSYHKDEDKTGRTFRVLVDGRPHTVPGDYATVEADGSLALLGRGSSCINTAGEKVHPEEVEEALKALTGVEDALVFGVDDERLGQRVAAVISTSAGADPSIDALHTALRDQLASYKLPRTVAVVDEVPRTSVGKPDYTTARELLTATPDPWTASTSDR